MSPTQTLPDTESQPPQQPATLSHPVHSNQQLHLPPPHNPTPTRRRRQHPPPHNPYHNNHHQTRNELTTWLRTSQRTATGPPTIPPPTPKPPTPDQTQPYQQQLFPSGTNEHWGDVPLLPGGEHTFRILSRNVNTLSPAEDFLEWRAAAQALSDYSITVACLQETNLQWSTPITKRIAQIFRQLPTKQTKIAVSNSSEVTTSNYQPGGTCTAILGPWLSSAKLSGQDPTGMGRWSYIELEGKEARRIIILTGYRSCNQNTKMGSATYHDQQIRILLSQGQLNPDPRTTFLDDLILQIRTWRTQKKAVLICLDANENVINPNLTQGIGRILTETDLFDLHYHRHPQHPRPATYNRGNTTIDVCMGSPEFVASMTAAAILPFGIPIQLTGDHRALILDFDSRVLFGHKPPPSRYIYNRGVNSNAAPTVTRFSKIVGTQCDIYDICSRIAAIEDLDHLTSADKVALNAIDRDLTNILTQADRKCQRVQDYPWSLTLHQAYLEHRYWTFQLSEFKTERSFAASYERIRPLLKDVDLTVTPPETICSKQRRARQKLREIRRAAVTKRKEFLNTLIQAARATKNKARKKKLSF